MGYFWPTCTWPWVCVRIQKAVAGFFDNMKHQTRFSGLHDIRTSSNCSLTGHDLWCRPCWMGWFGDPAMQWKAKDVWITMWNIWLKIAKATSTKLSSGWRSWKMDHFSFLSWPFFGPSLLAETETSFFTTQNSGSAKQRYWAGSPSHLWACLWYSSPATSRCQHGNENLMHCGDF